MLEKRIKNYLQGATDAKNPIDGNADYYQGKIDACKDILEFLKDDKPQGLDEAAKEWSEVFISDECKEACNYGFRVGAKWMAEQGVTTEMYVADTNGIVTSDKRLDLSKFQNGDKVIVQIRKANEKEK